MSIEIVLWLDAIFGHLLRPMARPVVGNKLLSGRHHAQRKMRLEKNNKNSEVSATNILVAKRHGALFAFQSRRHLSRFDVPRRVHAAPRRPFGVVKAPYVHKETVSNAELLVAHVATRPQGGIAPPVTHQYLGDIIDGVGWFAFVCDCWWFGRLGVMVR